MTVSSVDCSSHGRGAQFSFHMLVFTSPSVVSRQIYWNSPTLGAAARSRYSRELCSAAPQKQHSLPLLICIIPSDAEIKCDLCYANANFCVEYMNTPGWPGCNPLDICSGKAWFESRTWHRIFWLLRSFSQSFQANTCTSIRPQSPFLKSFPIDKLSYHPILCGY